ncbi:unnamed protein product [Miscanthus lutarioriparius]|uniref:Uncharacterized protein n=1 Tax=Miscanthus lutarioriparius TaxID=422564 RepID=A0A811PA43_9POAL|nr:unnamed protein product [Miscanthus lutarioriparius]
MADECPPAGGAELWLPDEFLDDDFFSEEEKAAVAANSESDEEEGVDGLSRRVAGLVVGNGKGGGETVPLQRLAEVLAGSPQSILCGLHASGEDSPNGVASQVSSPPSSPLDQAPADPWDLLSEAAGQVARLRTTSIPVPTNAAANQGHPVMPPAKVVSAPAEAPKAAGANHSQQNNSMEQRRIQIARFNVLKQQQLLKHQRERELAVATAAAWGTCVAGSHRAGAAGYGAPAPHVLSASAWPPLQKWHQQQQPPPLASPAGMRALFLTPPGAKRECAGTGVFIPRQAGAPAEPKKPACSPVLLPARVVQALNLNVEDLGAPSIYPGGFVLDHDALVSRSNALLAARSSQLHGAPSRELNLPQEWTY